MLKGDRGGERAFSPRRRTLFSFGDGLSALTAKLGSRLADVLMTGVRLDRIEPLAGGGWRLRLTRDDEVSALTVGAVVLALPAYAAARLLRPLDATAGEALASIAHPPVAVVFLGFPRASVAHPLDGLGALAPKLEGRSILGVLFSSTLFESRAPSGHVLLTAYVGGARQPELAYLGPEALFDLVEREARDLLGATGAPSFRRLRYWRQGLPQPGVGHRQRIAPVCDLGDRWPGLFVTGNFLDGVSTGHCIDGAFTAAARVDDFVRGGYAVAGAPAASTPRLMHKR